jgi:hypothetical protein
VVGHHPQPRSNHAHGPVVSQLAGQLVGSKKHRKRAIIKIKITPLSGRSKELIMNHKDILKRAWQILWNYKALWVFGFILAITTASGSGSNAANNAGNNRPGNRQPPTFLGDSFQQGWEEMTHGFELFFKQGIRTEIVNTIFTIAIVIACVVLLLIVATIIFRYMSETALIQLVDQYEDSGERLGVRQGFRLGFSRTAAKVFLVDLVVNLPLIILVIFMMLMFLAPLLLLLTASKAAGVLGVVVTIGLFFSGIFLAIVLGAAIALLKHFFRRAVAIEGLGVFEALSHGFQLVRENLANVVLMGLITLGLNIGYTIILIPVGFLTLLAAAIIGGGVGLTIGGLTSLLASGDLPIIVGVATGLPFFILLMVIPLGFLDGLRETFMSTTWTLTYREARALASLMPDFEEDEPLQELDTHH